MIDASCSIAEEGEGEETVSQFSKRTTILVIPVQGRFGCPLRRGREGGRRLLQLFLEREKKKECHPSDIFF